MNTISVCEELLPMLKIYSFPPLVGGNSKEVEVKNMTPEKIKECVTSLRNESGEKVEKIRKHWHTENPSIQGTWNPFLHKPPSLRKHVTGKTK